MIEKRFYKKTMASGKEYYLSEAIEKSKYLFGLITFTDKYNVMVCSDKKYYLHQNHTYNHQFNTLEEAEIAIDDAIKNRINNILNSTVQSYQLIKKQQ